MARLIEKIGLRPADYRVADGSGLSLYNYVTAELEVMLLRYAYQNTNIYTHLLPSLPVAADDGTLARRMRGTFAAGNVRGKDRLGGRRKLAGRLLHGGQRPCAMLRHNQPGPQARFCGACASRTACVTNCAARDVAVPKMPFWNERIRRFA